MIHTQEFLDIVNEEDTVIDKKERDLIHKKGLLHREIHLWFFDADQNIIFQKRGVEKSSGGLFDATVGGHVDTGEEYIDTVIRETYGETGLVVNQNSIIFLKKIRGVSENKLKETTNNFLRSMYIYTQPISLSQIKKEVSVKGVDFQTFTPEQLSNVSEEVSAHFTKFILTEEIPCIIEYLKTHNLSL